MSDPNESVKVWQVGDMFHDYHGNYFATIIHFHGWKVFFHIDDGDGSGRNGWMSADYLNNPSIYYIESEEDKVRHLLSL